MENENLKLAKDLADNLTKNLSNIVKDNMSQSGLSSDEIHVLKDIAKTYQAGKAIAVKVIMTALFGALVTAIGMGIHHRLKTIMTATGTGAVLAVLALLI